MTDREKHIDKIYELLKKPENKELKDLFLDLYTDTFVEMKETRDKMKHSPYEQRNFREKYGAHMVVSDLVHGRTVVHNHLDPVEASPPIELPPMVSDDMGNTTTPIDLEDTYKGMGFKPGFLRDPESGMNDIAKKIRETMSNAVNIQPPKLEPFFTSLIDTGSDGDDYIQPKQIVQENVIEKAIALIDSLTIDLEDIFSCTQSLMTQSDSLPETVQSYLRAVSSLAQRHEAMEMGEIVQMLTVLKSKDLTQLEESQNHEDKIRSMKSGNAMLSVMAGLKGTTDALELIAGRLKGIYDDVLVPIDIGMSIHPKIAERHRKIIHTQLTKVLTPEYFELLRLIDKIGHQKETYPEQQKRMDELMILIRRATGK